MLRRTKSTVLAAGAGALSGVAAFCAKVSLDGDAAARFFWPWDHDLLVFYLLRLLAMLGYVCANSAMTISMAWSMDMGTSVQSIGIVGVALLGESVTLWWWFGIALIVIGVAILK